MKPQPRPALKRAEDADLHPALSVAPTQIPAGRRGSSPDDQSAAPSKKGKGTSDTKSKSKPKGKRKELAQGKPYQGAGQATSDVLRGRAPDAAKPVTLKVKIPKKVRQELRSIAKHSGSSVDAIATQALTEWLGDPRRW